MLKLMFIAGDPDIARYAVDSGVNRIFVDLELRGKQERQGHRDTVISGHTFEAAEAVRAAIPDADLLLRLNPLWAGTGEEVERAVALGADWLMLPMFTCPEEVEAFCQLVGGRTKIVPLVETPQAAIRLPELLAKDLPLDELYVGLNDMHLAMGLDFMFELLASGWTEHLTTQIRAQGVPFGFGGIARMGVGDVPGEWVLGEHRRLGSSSVILSRAFHERSRTLEELRSKLDLPGEIQKLRREEERLDTQDAAFAERNRKQLADRVWEIAGRLRREKLRD